PHDDLKLGLHKTARYCYYPGWHEPGSVTEFTFNRKAYESLPKELQRILDYAAMSVKSLASAEYDIKNAAALRRLRTEFKNNVEILPFPADVIKALKGLSQKVNLAESEKSPMARKVYESYAQFQSLLHDWGNVSEGSYYQLIAG
ncbi:MAG TPA: ABC transporter substrate-binding protein, partial [Candidatus Binatia bacterium]